MRGVTCAQGSNPCPSVFFKSVSGCCSPLYLRKSRVYQVADRLPGSMRLRFCFLTLSLCNFFSSPERCPSGLRSTPGKRVCASRTQGSNPCLSAIIKKGPCRLQSPFFIVFAAPRHEAEAEIGEAAKKRRSTSPVCRQAL